MDSLPLIVQHSGYWDEDINYKKIKVFVDNPCAEGQISEAISSSVVNEFPDDLYTNGTGDFMDYAELISRQMVTIPTQDVVTEVRAQVRENEIIEDKKVKDLLPMQVYKDNKTIQIALSHYAINKNFQFKVQKSCIKEYLVKCVDNSCSWLLRASRNGKTNQFVIRRFVNIHNCALEIRFKGKRQASTTIIADTIKQKFTNIKTSYTVADIIRDMKHDHNINVTYNKAWRSKEKALEIVRGNATESFSDLYTYFYMLHTINAGSVIELQLTEDKCFMYVFVALHASIKGWNHCLPFVVVDGTFLKSAYEGTLLVAATQDVGGKIFPLAFVVDSENDQSWEWFFVKFRKAYGGREDMIIVTDRHESIIKGAGKVYPEVPNIFCIFHILGNIKAKFRKNLKRINDAFLSAENAYTVKEFDYHIKELEKVDKRVHPTNDIFFEVHNKDKKYIVDLRSKTYSCNRFQMEHIPCSHAIAILQKSDLDPYDYCSPYYKKETVVAAYNEIVYPVYNDPCDL
ncbi:uncharacterized protein LOC141713989 [Apium graveolens]|uniref:uncharacterized protein LOC141713989 n=1 Tax=Apium graveolens TaxID=4045 RepID=UPI003D7A8A4D